MEDFTGRKLRPLETLTTACSRRVTSRLSASVIRARGLCIAASVVSSRRG